MLPHDRSGKKITFDGLYAPERKYDGKRLQTGKAR